MPTIRRELIYIIKKVYQPRHLLQFRGFSMSRNPYEKEHIFIVVSNTGMYYLYFPVKDKQDVFRMGVETSKSPTGPFKAEPKPIEGSYSIYPAIFTDTDGKTGMYSGVAGADIFSAGSSVRIIRFQKRIWRSPTSQL